MREIPHHLTALFEALKFQDGRPERLRALRDDEWKNLLARWESSRFMTPLRQVRGEFLPGWVRGQIDRDIERNAERFLRIQREYAAIAAAFAAANAEHLVLKGFAHWPGYVDHPRFRRQSDIDVYCPPGSVERARDAAFVIGYQTADWVEPGPSDHLPPLVQKSKWKWRGDFYDPEMPMGLEIHIRLWDRESYGIGPENLDEFWQRRVARGLDDLRFPALDAVDAFGYFALHVLRDMLRGAVRPHNLYELARFLHTSADDEQFWRRWPELHDTPLRLLQAISCRLAAHVFSCRISQAVEREIACMPAAVNAWFEQFADSPMKSEFRPNKDMVWLNVSLLESAREKRAVVWKRLIPARVTPSNAPYLRNEVAGAEVKSRSSARWKRARHAAYLAGRAGYHARILPPTLWRGARWWLAANEIAGGFWTFFAACFFCDLGMYIFFFLYNLYLLDRGFKENFLGLLTSANSIGSIAGTIPAGILAQRLGLRTSLLICLTSVPVIFALRSVVMSEAWLLGLGFLGGAMFTIWAVCISPAIAQLTTNRNRTLGFSIIFSSGIAVGVLGGQAGGHLPGWFAHLGPSITAARAKQLGLLLACALIAMGTWPLTRLRFKPPLAREKKLYPRSPFLWRYLTVIAIWTFAVGAFSPFFNIYFSQYVKMPVKQIGTVYSASHLSQVIAMLAAPIVLRKLGMVTGLMYTQIAAAVALGCLAAVSAPSGAAAIYITYVAFLWMSEPGMLSLLMNQVAPSEQTGASAMNFLVTNVAQAVAAAAAGASFLRFGYPAVLGVTACVGLIAAFMFRILLGRDPKPVSQVLPA